MDWLTIAGILFLFTLAFSWLAAILGILAESVEGVQWMTFIIIFPLTFASSAFVSTENMGQYLKVFAENQPITQIINAIRALILGLPTENYVWVSVLWCVGTLIVAVPLAAWLFRTRANR